jgi:hypothetical protein
MNFQTFQTKSIQLAEALLVQETEAVRTTWINNTKDQMALIQEADEATLDAIWPSWTQIIICSCNEDVDGLAKANAEFLEIAQDLIDQINEAQAAPEPAVKDNGLYWGSIATGVAMAAFGGPAGWFAGYAVAKAGTAKAMGRF